MKCDTLRKTSNMDRWTWASLYQKEPHNPAAERELVKRAWSREKLSPAIAVWNSKAVKTELPKHAKWLNSTKSCHQLPSHTADEELTKGFGKACLKPFVICNSSRLSVVSGTFTMPSCHHGHLDVVLTDATLLWDNVSAINLLNIKFLESEK